MTELDLIAIPAGRGKAARVKTGQHVRIVNTFGTQCVDTWAFVDGHMDQIMSMERCREAHKRICFEVGDVMISNAYTTMFTIVTDTSPGSHDSIIPACSEATYVWAGHPEGHGNCSDNLRAALGELGVAPLYTPSPWNLFMLAPVADGLHIEYQRPTSKPGDYVELRAEADCIIVFSACPDDVWPTNGGDGKPVDAHFAIFDTDI